MKTSKLLKTLGRTFATVLAFATLVGSSACDDSQVPGSPTDLSSPAQAVASAPRDGFKNTRGGNAAKLTLVTYLSPAAGDFGASVIGSNGGKLMVGKNVIDVPRGAVTEDVMFSMQIVPGDTVVVRLNATRVSNGQPYGLFAAPVSLKLSYADANVTNETALVVAYLVDGTTAGKAQPLSTSVKPQTKSVTAQLEHFSDYALGEN